MLEFTGIAIETPLQTWRWDDIQATPIKAVAEPLVSLSYLPEKMVISPQYFIQQLPGAKADLFARETVQRKLNEAADLLPYGYKFVIFDAWRDMATQQALFDQMRAFVKRDHPDFDDQQVTQAALRIVALQLTRPNRPHIILVDQLIYQLLTRKAGSCQWAVRLTTSANEPGRIIMKKHLTATTPSRTAKIGAYSIT